jgi:hypothetical protein
MSSNNGSAKATFYAASGRKPKVVEVRPEGIPAELKARDQWVGWVLQWNAKAKKWDKPPIDIRTGQYASSTNPDTWATFDAVMAEYRLGHLDGVGFVFTPDDAYVGVDLDDAMIEPASLYEWSRQIVEDLDTYSEVSPSMTGVKLLLRGRLPDGCAHEKPCACGKVEVYDRGRYFTITGNTIQGGTIEDRQQGLDSLLRRLKFVEERKSKTAYRRAPGDPTAEARRIADALRYVPGADDYARWIEVGFALNSCNQVEGFALWCDWSSQSQKFTEEACRSKWRGFKPDGKVRIGTVFALAKQNGWTNGQDVKKRRPADPPSGGGAGPAAAGQPGGDEPQPGAVIILGYYRERYRPVFRVGTAIRCEDGSQVPMGEGTVVLDSTLVDRLAGAVNAPRYESGAINRNRLPGFFKLWAKVAWGDLLQSLPDEDAAALGPDAPAGDEFRRQVAAVMHTEVTLGNIIRQTDATQTERRSVIGWCERFARPGPWRSIRSLNVWTKRRVLNSGEEVIAIAIRHELFAQLKGDRQLLAMGATKFARRAAKYAVGSSSRKDRPHGLTAVVLDQDFVAELLAPTQEFPDADEAPAG